MVWVVKFKDGQYHMSHNEGIIYSGVRSERARATRFVQRSEALRAASIWSDDLEPRIVRLKPRASRSCVHPPGCERCNWCGFKSESLIRREERERIAGALAHGNAMQSLLLGDRVLMSRYAKGDPVPQARYIIMEFDWKPEQK